MEKIYVIALYSNNHCTIGKNSYNDYLLAKNVVKQQAEEMQNSNWFKLNGFKTITNFEGYFYAENKDNENIRICIFETQLENNLSNIL